MRRIKLLLPAWAAFFLAAGALACTGDCGGDGVVTVDEVVAAVNLALDGGPTDGCARADADASGDVTVDEVVAAVNHALSGCPLPSPTATATEPLPTPTPSPDGIPTSGAQLRPWLQAGNYLGWRAESGAHASGGPHPVTVRTYVNDLLFDSLAAGDSAHPPGAAAVKELYGASSTLDGWAVSVKVAGDSGGGSGWYWYERVGSRVYADGTGAGICTGCHGDDYREFVSKDFILIPFPLQ